MINLRYKKNILLILIEKDLNSDFVDKRSNQTFSSYLSLIPNFLRWLIVFSIIFFILAIFLFWFDFFTNGCNRSHQEQHTQRNCKAQNQTQVRRWWDSLSCQYIVGDWRASDGDTTNSRIRLKTCLNSFCDCSNERFISYRNGT